MLFIQRWSIKQNLSVNIPHTLINSVQTRSDFYLLTAQAEQEQNTQMRGNHSDFTQLQQKTAIRAFVIWSFTHWGLYVVEKTNHTFYTDTDTHCCFKSHVHKRINYMHWVQRASLYDSLLLWFWPLLVEMSYWLFLLMSCKTNWL